MRPKRFWSLFFAASWCGDKRAPQIDVDNPGKGLVLHPQQKAVLCDAGIVHQYGKIQLAPDFGSEKSSTARLSPTSSAKAAAEPPAILMFSTVSTACSGLETYVSTTWESLAPKPERNRAANAAGAASYQSRGHFAT